MDDCIFCRIVSRETPAAVVHETDTSLAFFPLEPATRGHTMVIPKRHIDHFLDLDASDTPGLAVAVLEVGRALQAVLKPEGMNVITSAGEPASQSVRHMHVHVVPRYAGDAIGEIWPPKIPTADWILEELAHDLRKILGNGVLGGRNPKDDGSED